MAQRNKAAGKSAGGLDLRGMAVALLAGGCCIAVAAQLMAKPNPTKIAAAIERGSGPSQNGRNAGAPLTTRVSGPLQLAAEPPVRELFTPLVSKPKTALNLPKPVKTGPTLPPVKPPV